MPTTTKRMLRRAVAAPMIGTLAIIGCGLAGRAALDKVLALRGGAELVALWAQLASVIEVVSGSALSGVGTGIAVLVAQSRREPKAYLAASLKLGLAVAGAVAVALLPLGWFFPRFLGWLVLGAAVGWLVVVAGVFNGYWLGLRERGKMLALAAAGAGIPVLTALLAPGHSVLLPVALAHALPAVVLLLFLPREPSGDARPLLRYVLPGLSIGILSPASYLAGRAIVAGEMSWHDVGLLQALWRVTDWVAAIAWGVLSVIFLPRLSAAAGTPAFPAELRRAMLVVAAPSFLALLALFLVQGEVISLLYEPGFVVSETAAALFFAGSAVRVVAWVALVGLYALHRTRAIALGEVLSLPLFTLLLFAWPGALTLEAAGVAWLLSFSAYATFNVLRARG